MKLKDITPYEYERLGSTTFVIKFQEEIAITIENTTEEHVKKTTGFLNGAFREGVIFGQFNKIEI